jgi:hypothetical protein
MELRDAFNATMGRCAHIDGFRLSWYIKVTGGRNGGEGVQH